MQYSTSSAFSSGVKISLSNPRKFSDWQRKSKSPTAISLRLVALTDTNSLKYFEMMFSPFDTSKFYFIFLDLFMRPINVPALET
jgi:hypothetical protein